MTAPPPIITLLTDFGESDAYVGIMKGVILGIAPTARLVDLTHQIAPQDIRQAGLILSRAYAYFPAHTVHLVVVDPGVGSQRRAIAVETPQGRFVAPDNGVLSYVLAGEAEWIAVALTQTRYQLPDPSHTFHGRDIFSPVAAFLATGIALDQLGSPVRDLAWLSIPRLSITSTALQGEVTNVDRFGNVITNILSLHWLDEHTLRFTPVPAQAEQMAFPPSFKAAEASVTIGWHTLRGIHATYGNVSPGQAVAIVGSNHDLEIAVNQGRAADTLGIKTGTPVILRV